MEITGAFLTCIWPYVAPILIVSGFFGLVCELEMLLSSLRRNP